MASLRPAPNPRPIARFAPDEAIERADLVAAAALAIAAALAFLLLPSGSLLRLCVGLAFLLLVPGYLLVQAASRPVATASRHLVRVAIGIGVGPVVVGLAALATAAFPSGFKPAALVAATTGACLALAALAYWRRRVARARDVGIHVAA